MQRIPVRWLLSVYLFGTLASAQVPTQQPVVLASNETRIGRTIPATSMTIPAEYRRLLSAAYIHGFPLSVANRLLAHPRSFEWLKAVLDHTEQQELWENATLALGISGDPRAYAVLFEFFQRDDSPAAICKNRATCKTAASSLTDDVYYAKANVPVALGLLLNKIDAVLETSTLTNHEREMLAETRTNILAFLKAGVRVGDQCWPGVVWRAFGGDTTTMYWHLTLRCIDGLAVSGDEAALERLRWLLDEHLTRLDSKLGTAQGRDDLKSLGFSGTSFDPEALLDLRAAAEAGARKNVRIHNEGLAHYYTNAQTTKE